MSSPPYYRRSPPLHHPIPQHISQVPNLRSPPPPQPQPQTTSAGAGYAPQTPGQTAQQDGGFMRQPNFGGFLNDPTAQMGLSLGQNAAKAGQQYMEQNFTRYINVNALRHYFDVTNSYVVHKLILVLFPWRHRTWVRQNYDGFFLPPREDINSPDLYIPVNAFVTHILATVLVAGLHGNYRPELFGIAASTAIGCIMFEIIAFRVGCFVLNLQNKLGLIELVAYSGYKFVGAVLTEVLSEVMGKAQFGAWIGWVVFLYFWLALGFFIIRSIRHSVLPNSAAGVGYRAGREHSFARNLFLFVYSFILQGVIMVWLS